jgi:hypothetical protein
MFSCVANAPTLHIYVFRTREGRNRYSVPICTERTVKGFHPIILTSRQFIALFVTLHYAIQFFLSSTSSENPSLHSLCQWNHRKLKITDEYRITYWPLVEIEFQSEWYVLIVDISNDLISVWRDCHVIIPQADFFLLRNFVFSSKRWKRSSTKASSRIICVPLLHTP